RCQIPNYNTSMIALTEKLFQLCIQFLTQPFPNGDDPQSPLSYFTAVMGIDIVNGRFHGPQNYTSPMAGILWIARLLLLEYALPKREYVTLGWPSRETYEDHGFRL